MLTAILLRGFAAEDEESGGEGVAVRRAGGDDGDADHALGGAAGDGIDDMTVADSLVLEELLVFAGGGEGFVLQIDGLQRRFVVAGIADGKRPSLLDFGFWILDWVRVGLTTDN